jgi:GNAT superfamily N-acetyltransferase
VALALVRPATIDDAPALAPTLARAFHDDPVAKYALPSDRRRPKQLARFYSERLRTLIEDELVFTDEDRRGAALWAAPDRWRTPLAELLRTRIFTRNTPLFLLGGARVEHRHPRNPHFYLAILGVEPTAQGRGLGSQLLGPMLDRCDREHVPAYLESSKAENVPFYERHGFQVTEEVDLLWGPKMWLMWRPPR